MSMKRIEIGDVVKFKIRRAGYRGTFIEVEGIINGVTEIFGKKEYLITEWKGTEPIKTRNVEKIIKK